ncbi:bifunctional transcriptional activator/DNA repair enzyme AdaA [Paenibacillus sp. GCM10023248]|uniref:bifunctional transcriptional activator/DNA repair enzyme AdaA n=1 Tax=unclassified Paenibacillus TaxID=185978 RepID=UPI002379B554|nr:bifunctional transcriptional activator/DNA repair enzyme AdaA [Paenibacillus sp. MAHUQ-63]MDD9266934.1 bifunctional transcriptional activator/DNA repair enzyme AdaA [Paenibacillus sp. MAHUQ-63]
MQERYWQAIVSNDAAYDGTFYYAVTTTGIFCRPSCKSRVPKREHVRIFGNRQAAAAENFRPCKRCRPDGMRLPDEEWTDLIAGYIAESYAEPITLAVLADHFYASIYHLQRTFKRVKGVTPLTYLQQTRVDAAKRLLLETEMPVSMVGGRVGIGNAAHFATLFQKKTGLTPTEYRQTAAI